MRKHEMKDFDPNGYRVTKLVSGKWKLWHKGDERGYMCKRGNPRRFYSMDIVVSTLASVFPNSKIDLIVDFEDRVYSKVTCDNLELDGRCYLSKDTCIDEPMPYDDSGLCPHIQAKSFSSCQYLSETEE